VTTEIRDLVLTNETIGEAWLAVAEAILRDGRPSRYDDLAIRELDRVTLTVRAPSPTDALVEQLGDPARLAWMHANFTDHSLVPELGDARSYASRLFDYGAAGRDQIEWLVERLNTDPTSRSATITTFEPLLDTTYIPCVSLLDFWMRDGKLDQIVYAHSIDFGAKGYANLVQLAELQRHVATRLGRPAGRLTFVVKSAHVYDTEAAWMRSVLAQAPSR
jgi:thymidylate synthase